MCRVNSRDLREYRRKVVSGLCLQKDRKNNNESGLKNKNYIQVVLHNE